VEHSVWRLDQECCESVGVGCGQNGGRQTLGSERDWGFHTAQSPHLNGRPIPYPMGKVLGGGSNCCVLSVLRKCVELML
jgi:choline dehydrogenase-like flavoprotein